jgi:hypothetical protein
MGGEQFNIETNGLTETVFVEDCKAVNNNRIKGVSFRISDVVDLTKQEENIAEQPVNKNNSSNNSNNSYGSNNYSSGSNNYGNNKDNNRNNNSVYQQEANNYLNMAKNPNNTAITTSGYLDQAQLAATVAGNTAQAQQIQRERQQMQQQNNQQIANNIVELGGTISNLIGQKSAKREEQRQKWQQDQEEQKQKDEEWAQKKIEMDAQNKRATAYWRGKAEEERNRQFEKDQNILGQVAQDITPNEIGKNINQVYYVAYERNYTNGVVNVKTYALNKYSDGSYMMKSDMLDKIKFKVYLENSGVGMLLGAYSDKNSAVALLNRIKANAPNANIDRSFLILNNATANAGTDKDFWDN